MSNSELVIDKALDRLRNELSDGLKEITQTLEEEIKTLEKQLEIAETSSKMLRMERELDQLKRDNTERRIVCLIDGDGSIFLSSHIARGQAGGHAVAMTLTEHIRKALPSGDNARLHVWAYFNKSGLAKTLGAYGKDEARNRLEDFMHGFNQAAERFVMIDIGYGKEMADAKIKANLEDEVKASQTSHIIFSGCHDTGYITTLRSLITAGYSDKLVLMPGYREMAAGFDALKLQILDIPNLFEPEKFGAQTHRRPSIASAPPSGISLARRGRSGSLASSISGSPPLKTPTAMQYSAVVLTSTASVTYKRGATPPLPKSRHIDPTKPMSKQDPPPCNLFYLTDNGCRRGEECQFAHDYILSSEHLEMIKENSSKSPCVAINTGKVCPFGDKCCFGHKCPGGPACSYRKLGTCKFVGAGMH